MKKQYRIELKEIDTIFTDCVLVAAMSNGGDYMPLNQIANIADELCRRYPTTGETHTVNRIGNNSLTIDKGTTNILILTEVEILELNTLEELSNEEAKGILNDNFHENLN